ncbi:MAG: hypothetical protein MPI95_01790 [Nitrosopumilus sp.]|nr:hypothetical protein [Nitrosopumilus sp.]CAI9831504.1 hypothetical protein IBTHAUMO2_260030 [Nitrosopumilaceae archaeon]MDA7940788.1 hypothetical protein [Nitrosopumilus sp.]MDA7942996.1 hypothetical protein [Nitrosopumilus sp.]MDA7944593.1 hypothetical protein [Nitrosopumilus sp.]
MSFGDLCSEIEEAAGRHSRSGTPARVERTGDRIIRVYGAGVTPVEAARDGLSRIQDLAEGTAEHHPYWAAVAGCAGILEALLDGWDGRLGPEEVSRVRWDLGRIGRAVG